MDHVRMQTTYMAPNGLDMSWETVLLLKRNLKRTRRGNAVDMLPFFPPTSSLLRILLSGWKRRIVKVEEASTTRRFHMLPHVRSTGTHPAIIPANGRYPCACSSKTPNQGRAQHLPVDSNSLGFATANIGRNGLVHSCSTAVVFVGLLTYLGKHTNTTGGPAIRSWDLTPRIICKRLHCLDGIKRPLRYDVVGPCSVEDLHMLENVMFDAVFPCSLSKALITAHGAGEPRA